MGCGGPGSEAAKEDEAFERQYWYQLGTMPFRFLLKLPDGSQPEVAPETVPAVWSGHDKPDPSELIGQGKAFAGGQTVDYLIECCCRDGLGIPDKLNGQPVGSDCLELAKRTARFRLTGVSYPGEAAAKAVVAGSAGPEHDSGLQATARKQLELVRKAGPAIGGGQEATGGLPLTDYSGQTRSAQSAQSQAARYVRLEVAMIPALEGLADDVNMFQYAADAPNRGECGMTQAELVGQLQRELGSTARAEDLGLGIKPQDICGTEWLKSPTLTGLIGEVAAAIQKQPARERAKYYRIDSLYKISASERGLPDDQNVLPFVDSFPHDVFNTIEVDPVSFAELVATLSPQVDIDWCVSRYNELRAVREHRAELEAAKAEHICALEAMEFLAKHNKQAVLQAHSGEAGSATPLMKAAFDADTWMVKMLLDCGVDPNHTAVSTHSTDPPERQQDSLPDIEKGELSPLDMACLSRSRLVPRSIRLLLAAKANINQSTGPFGFSPLHRAVYANNAEAVSTLVEAGAEVSRATDLCPTPPICQLNLSNFPVTREDGHRYNLQLDYLYEYEKKIKNNAEDIEWIVVTLLEANADPNPTGQWDSSPFWQIPDGTGVQNWRDLFWSARDTFIGYVPAGSGKEAMEAKRAEEIKAMGEYQEEKQQRWIREYEQQKKRSDERRRQENRERALTRAERAKAAAFSEEAHRTFRENRTDFW